MTKFLYDDDKEKAEKKGIEDALKGNYEPKSVDQFYFWHSGQKTQEARDVYKEAFFKTRGSEPPKR